MTCISDLRAPTHDLRERKRERRTNPRVAFK